MDPKSKIKIDSFEVTRMYLADIPDILKFAITAQSSFGVSPYNSPSAFLQEISKILQENTRYSFVFRHKNKVGAAFIIRPQTSKTAELLYSFTNPNAIQTNEMYDAFLNKINQLGFEIIYAPVYKKRKRLEAYIKLLNILGFKKIFNEDDLYLTLIYEKLK